MANSPFRFLLVILALALVSASLCCPSVFAEGQIQGQEVVEAFKCFDNKFIYNGCESAYRLNPSGSFNVPPEATNMFCNGPCLIETQLVLNCLNGAFENFLFYNKAMVQNFQNALRVGCSYSSQRGIGGGTSMKDCLCKENTAKATTASKNGSHYIMLFLLLGVVFSSC